MPRFLWRYTAALLASLMFSNPLLSAPPAWWATRDVTPSSLSSQRDDYAVANVGQVKTLAKKAMLEMDAAWPGTGAGTAIHTMVDAWAAAPPSGVTRDDYAAVNLGQLKTVAKPFYDRLIQLGLRPANSYPWSGVTTPKDDFALANIGQVKTVFAFEIPGDSDGDGMPDTWELAHGLNPSNPADANGDPDGDDLTNLQEYVHQTDPHMADTDGDGFEDGFEVEQGTDPLNPGSHPLALAQQKLAALQAKVAAYLNFMAAGTLTIDQLSALWAEISADQRSLQDLLLACYDIITDTTLLAQFDTISGGLDTATGNAGVDPGTPPDIFSISHVRTVSDWWYSDEGPPAYDGGELTTKLDNATVFYDSDYYPDMAETYLSAVEWPTSYQAPSSGALGLFNAASSSKNTQSPLGGTVVDAKDTRYVLAANKTVPFDIVQSFVRILHYHDFRNGVTPDDTVLSVDTLTIDQGHDQSSSTKTVTHPEVVDGVNQDIKVWPVQIVRDVDEASNPTVNWQPVAGNVAKCLPGQQINLSVADPPAGISITDYHWDDITGTVFKRYEADARHGQRIDLPGDERVFPVITFHWVEPGIKRVHLSCKVDGKPAEATVIIQVVPYATQTLSVTKVESTRYKDTSSTEGKAGVLENTGKWGIEWKGQIDVPAEFDVSKTGRFAFCQLVTPQRSFTDASGVITHPTNNGSKGLDSQFPYGATLPNEYSLGASWSRGDSPNTRSMNPTTLKRLEVNAEAFETYLIFKPEGTQSQWVPVKKFEWNYSIICVPRTFFPSLFGLYSTSSSSTPAPSSSAVTTDHPKWTIKH